MLISKKLKAFLYYFLVNKSKFDAMNYQDNKIEINMTYQQDTQTTKK